MTLLLDSYDRKARLAPGLLAFTPLVLPLLALGPIETGVAAGLEGIGGYALGNVARVKGKGLEPSLWRSWGGPPTASALRHRSATNPELLRQAHAGIQVLTGIPMPTPHEEDADPTGTDQRYDAAAQVAIERFRSEEGGRLIEQENATYGYYRNLLGLRRLGRVASVAGLTASLTIFASSLQWALPSSAPLAGLACLAAGGLVWFWVFHIREPYVRRAAEQLATAVLRAAAAVQKS